MHVIAVVFTSHVHVRVPMTFDTQLTGLSIGTKTKAKGKRRAKKEDCPTKLQKKKRRHNVLKAYRDRNLKERQTHRQTNRQYICDIIPIPQQISIKKKDRDSYIVRFHVPRSRVIKI